ncbi:MAG: hypothetical protein KGZ59_12655 [Chitinophagaceae bacterium]|nr:hypothetical protein [Chitinophagaceae bacterium]
MPNITIAGEGDGRKLVNNINNSDKLNRNLNNNNTILNGNFSNLSYERLEHEYAPTNFASALIDSAKSVFTIIENNGKWITTLAENASTSVPFGLKKKLVSTDYYVAFSNIQFTSSGAVARVFAKCILPQRTSDGNKKELYFAGFVNLSRTGGVISDGKLQLIGDDAVKTDNQWSIVLNGNNPSINRKKEEQTYFKIDCTGFIELGINGEIILSKDNYIPLNATSWEPLSESDTRVSASITNYVTTSWDKIMIPKLSFSKPFRLKNVSQYFFQIEEATLDFSDERNPDGGPDFVDYIKTVQSDFPNTWRGICISKMQIGMPKEFKSAEAQKRIIFSSTYAFIDAVGFTTDFSQKNVVPISKGRAGGWPFSVDEFSLTIKKGNLFGGALSGTVVLPIENKNASGKKGIHYTGTFNKDGDYSFSVGNLKDIKADIWKVYLEIDKSSQFTMAVIDGEFRPKVSLTGKLGFNFDGNKDDEIADKGASSGKKKAFSLEGVKFEELVLQTQKPYISIKAMGIEGSLHIASFSADYSVEVITKTKPTSVSSSNNNEFATLAFAADIKLMAGKIAGKTKLNINAIYNTSNNAWEYYNTELEKIGIKADFGKAKFEGELGILKNDDVYGNAFAGSLSLKVNKFEVGAKGIFGNKDGFRYWSVDAMAKGFKLQAGPITFTGFTGGVTYKMNVADKPSDKLPSGILYEPDNNQFLRVRAGVLFDILTKELIDGSAGFEIVFNNNWGVNSITLNGTLRMLTADDNKGEARMKGSMRKFANAKTSAAPKEDAAIWGDILIKFDIENAEYSAEMNSYVNFNDYVIGGMGNYQSGKAQLFVSSEKWYIYNGTDKQPNSIKLNGPVNVTGTGYFMMGNDIPSPYGSGNFALKHGLSAHFSLSANIGWLWAEFGGGVRYDILLMRTENFKCNGSPAGLGGWFGEGRVSAGLYGSVGARFHKRMPWFLPDINITATIFKASLNANLFLSGPKPFYASGHVSGRYSVFIFSGSFGVDFSVGTRCGTPPPPPYRLNAKDQAIEDEIKARRDSLVKRLNDLIGQQKFNKSKDYLKQANTNYFDAKLWATPINLIKNNGLLKDAIKFMDDFIKIKNSEPPIINSRDSTLNNYNDELKLEKNYFRKTILNKQVQLLTEEKTWSTPIDQPAANKLLKKINTQLDSLKTARINEFKLIDSINQNITNNKPIVQTKLNDLLALNKKMSTTTNPMTRANLAQKYLSDGEALKKLGLGLKRDQLIVDLYKELDLIDNEADAKKIVEKINKLKTTTIDKIENLIDQYQKDLNKVYADREKLAKEKKELEDLKVRQTKAITESPALIKLIPTNQNATKVSANKAVETLSKATKATEIKTALDKLNSLLKTNF